MQKIPFAVLNIYYGIFAFIATALIIVGEAVIFEKPIRILSYDRKQYGITILASIINFGTISSQTIAM